MFYNRNPKNDFRFKLLTQATTTTTSTTTTSNTSTAISCTTTITATTTATTSTTTSTRKQAILLGAVLLLGARRVFDGRMTGQQLTTFVFYTQFVTSASFDVGDQVKTAKHTPPPPHYTTAIVRYCAIVRCYGHLICSRQKFYPKRNSRNQVQRVCLTRDVSGRRSVR